MGNDTNALLQPTQEQDSGSAAERVQTAPSLQEAANEACFAHFAVVIEYRGQEQITELRLPQDIIAKLAFEAEFRGIRIGGLIGAIIAAIMKKDLLPLILDTEEDTKNPQTVAGTEIRVGSGHFEA
jgi:hypothetical protein